jgi:hypothetical protein
VRQALQGWAANHKLIFVSLYFWISGEPLQRSIEGFYRSLLLHVLRQCPELIQQTFCKAASLPPGASPENHPFRLPELREAIRTLTSIRNLDDYRLFLLIDGLDEYEGDSVHHMELARQLRMWSENTGVKILCSARPEREFLECFETSGSVMRLQDYTLGDIKRYSSTELKKHLQLRKQLTKSEAQDVQKLCEKITSLSDGVFLWAYLVVRSLSNKIGVYDLTKLQDMLQKTPRTLGTLFDSMLEKIDPLERERGNEMLLLTIRNPSPAPLNALAYSWLDDLKNPDFPFSNEPTGYSNEDIERRITTVRRELSDLTSGLLEIISNKYSDNGTCPFYKYLVQPFHRTVKDYLLEQSDATQGHTTKLHFNDKGLYCRIFLAEMKFSLRIDLFSRIKANNEPFPAVDHFRCYDFEGKIREVMAIIIKTPSGMCDSFIHELQAVSRMYENFLSSNDMAGYSPYAATGITSLSMSTHEFQEITDRKTPLSLVHYSLFWDNHELLGRQLRQAPNMAEVDTESHKCVLTSLYLGNTELAKGLVRYGASLADKIRIKKYDSLNEQRFTYHSVSLWILLLRLFAHSVKSYLASQGRIWGRDSRHKPGAVLEPGIWETRQDADIIFLVENINDYERGGNLPEPTIDEAEIEGRDLQYMDLNQLLDLAIMTNEYGLAQPARDFKAMSESHKWGSKWMGQGVLDWFSIGSNGRNLAAEFRGKYPRVDIDDFKTSRFAIHGVASRSEKLIGDFWVAIA